MIPYRIQEADMAIPETWSDQSINIFKIPANENHGEASFVVSRDPSQGETPFTDYVTGQIESARNQLPGFRFSHREDFELRGHSASSIRYQWDSNGRELMLCQVFIESKPAVIILTLTTTPEDSPHHASVWKEVIRGYRPVPGADPSHDTPSPKKP
jgi:hypothetical protein